MQPSAMPARAVTNAYTADPFLDEADEVDDDDPGDLFRSLLDESSVFASTLADALEREPEPEEPAPAFEPILIEPAQLGPPAPVPDPEPEPRAGDGNRRSSPSLPPRPRTPSRCRSSSCP